MEVDVPAMPEPVKQATSKNAEPVKKCVFDCFTIVNVEFMTNYLVHYVQVCKKIKKKFLVAPINSNFVVNLIQL